MTYKDVATMIGSLKLPYAYYQFPDGTEQEPPFICFLYTDSDDFYADGLNFQAIRPLVIELYTDNKDFSLEAQMEACLLAHGLAYEKTETYIDVERMFQISYSVEIVITEDENGKSTVQYQ